MIMCFCVLAKDSRKLTFMYLANDVIQNSKKKGPEFGKEFGGVLKKAFEHMSSMGYDEKTRGSLLRVLNIWGERGVYDPKQITDFKRAFGKSFITIQTRNDVQRYYFRIGFGTTE